MGTRLSSAAAWPGCMAARVLADHFARVTLDRAGYCCPKAPEQRRGVPQGHQGHGLLSGGQRAMEGAVPRPHRRPRGRGGGRHRCDRGYDLAPARRLPPAVRERPRRHLDEPPAAGGGDPPPRAGAGERRGDSTGASHRADGERRPRARDRGHLPAARRGQLPRRPCRPSWSLTRAGAGAARPPGWRPSATSGRRRRRSPSGSATPRASTAAVPAICPTRRLPSASRRRRTRRGSACSCQSRATAGSRPRRLARRPRARRRRGLPRLRAQLRRPRYLQCHQKRRTAGRLHDPQVPGEPAAALRTCWGAYPRATWSSATRSAASTRPTARG